MKKVREGMARVVPVPLLSIFTSGELEAMVCGSPEIPINMLLSIVTYKGTYKKNIFFKPMLSINLTEY